MLIEETDLPGVMIVTPRRHGDARGFFAETYNRDVWAAAGLALPPLREEVEIAPSLGQRSELSDKPSRGLLLRCARGAVRITVADGDTQRPPFTVDLSADDGRQLWVPPGHPAAWQALQPGSLIIANATDYGGDAPPAVPQGAPVASDQGNQA